ncbi:uncharacterized protein A4U43_C03F24790 [Asparagus officinalis]|uniref:Protein root UVB sensitive 3 n=1 Tax=Asparagus officinalis TaxID=4686 RepID=A0A5P1FDJ6_ASPOF|nr:uncharacterized protein A4U43_C03F24790 [Asparagus officinalis]
MITVEEWRGSSSAKLSKTATISATSSSLHLHRSESRFTEIWRKILEAFVPEGFPGSVTPDYVPFQIWDSLQGLSTYIRSMLSTQALLSAIGVGEKSATVIGATFQWFLRDFMGMLGGIIFTFYQGSNLDSNAKMWRLVADFMNDLAGVASGATRAALTQHFSLQNNAADISAKEGSQETVATMIGMALGMILAHITRGHPLAVWILFLSLTLFHMFANYMAVRCLSLTTLNNERCSLLLQHFMETGQVLSPQQISRMEHVFPIWVSSWSSGGKTKSYHKHIRLGAKVSSLKHADMMELSGLASSHYKKATYLLLEKKGYVHVLIHKHLTASDILQAFIHALVIANYLDKSKAVHTESRLWMDEKYTVFLAKLKSAGWTTERLLSPSIAWRSDWSHSTEDEKIS